MVGPHAYQLHYSYLLHFVSWLCVGGWDGEEETREAGREAGPFRLFAALRIATMGRRPAASAAARASSPATTQTQKQRPANASVYRVVIEPPRNTQPFGSVINDASLLQALNEFGPVFHLDAKSSSCCATFKSTATVDKLIAAKTLTISGIVCSTNYYFYVTVRCLGPALWPCLWLWIKGPSTWRAVPVCTVTRQA